MDESLRPTVECEKADTEYRVYLYPVQGQTRLTCGDRDQIVATAVFVPVCVCGRL